MKEDEGEAVDFSARWTECRSSVNQAEVNGEALNTCRRRDIRIRETAGICHSDRGTSVAEGRTTHVGPRQRARFEGGHAKPGHQRRHTHLSHSSVAHLTRRASPGRSSALLGGMVT